MGAAPRQSQLQYHVSDDALVARGAGGDAESCVAPLGEGVDAVFAGAAAVESGVTDPPATLTCETGPLSPGLSMRTLTLMFAEAGLGAGAAGALVEGVGGVGWVAAGGVSAAVSAVTGVISVAPAASVAGSGIAAGA